MAIRVLKKNKRYNFNHEKNENFTLSLIDNKIDLENKKISFLF